MIEAQDRETAAAIRIALYRAVPDMPSYAAGIIEPYLERHRQQAEEAMRERCVRAAINEIGLTVLHEKNSGWLGWSSVKPEVSLRRLAERVQSAIRGIDAGGEGQAEPSG